MHPFNMQLSVPSLARPGFHSSLLPSPPFPTKDYPRCASHAQLPANAPLQHAVICAYLDTTWDPFFLTAIACFFSQRTTPDALHLDSCLLVHPFNMQLLCLPRLDPGFHSVPRLNTVL